jgi:hypothetical protein
MSEGEENLSSAFDGGIKLFLFSEIWKKGESDGRPAMCTEERRNEVKQEWPYPKIMR